MRGVMLNGFRGFIAIGEMCGVAKINYLFIRQLLRNSIGDS